MKIAVIFYGQMRFVNNPYSRQSHHQLESMYNVDYFGHVWNSFTKVDAAGSSEVKKHVSSWSRIAVDPFTDNDLKHLLSAYTFKSLTTSEPINFLERRPDLIAAIEDVQVRQGREVHPTKNKRDIANTLSHLYSFESSITNFLTSPLLEDYDFVLLTRTDNFLVKVPNLHLLDKSRKAIYISSHHDCFPDTIILATPESVKALMVYSKMEKMLASTSPIMTTTPESFKELSIILHPTKIEVVPMTSSKFPTLGGEIINNGTVGGAPEAVNSSFYSRFVRDHDNPPCRDHSRSMINKSVWEPKKKKS
jgi:hypothetical protein